MGLGDFLFGEAPTTNEDLERTERGYSDILSTLKSRLNSADKRAGMSVRDLYGDSIDRSADMVRSNANATKAALGRLGTARGGDVSGAEGATFNRIDENTNENVSDIIQYYSDRASTDREQAQARGDRILNQQGNIQSRLGQLAQSELQRQLQKRQGNAQLATDIIGSLAQVGAAAAGSCWVAEELYGKWSPVTFAIRAYVLEQSKRWTPIGLFARAYRRFGKQWAHWVRESDFVRNIAEIVFGWLGDRCERLTLKVNRQ